MLEFPKGIVFDDKLCKTKILSLRKERPLLESNSKFHISHIQRELRLQFEQIGLKDETLISRLLDETESIYGIPGLVNSLISACIRHQCSAQFLRDVIDQYDSNGDVSGIRLLISINRMKKTLWEYNILEKVDEIESMFYTWSFRRCIFEMNCVNEVKSSLYTPSMIVTKILHKSNHHHVKLDEFASNSILIFDMLHDEFLQTQNESQNEFEDKTLFVKHSFSFDDISSSTLLDCIKSLGLDVDSENREHPHSNGINDNSDNGNDNNDDDNNNHGSNLKKRKYYSWSDDQVLMKEVKN